MSIYIELYHGRTDKNADMDDWGTQGPVLGPFKYLHSTYKATLRFMPLDDSRDECWLNYEMDMVHYDNVYYGDFTIFSDECLTDELKQRLQPFETGKATRAIVESIPTTLPVGDSGICAGCGDKLVCLACDYPDASLIHNEVLNKLYLTIEDVSKSQQSKGNPV